MQMMSTQILTGRGLRWKEYEMGRFPYAAIKSGYGENRVPLFVGRAVHEGNVLVGKIHPQNNRIYVPYKGREYSYNKYEMLLAGRPGM